MMNRVPHQTPGKGISEIQPSRLRDGLFLITLWQNFSDGIQHGRLER
ncbi:hypothetical protein [Glaesserella sp.]